MKRKVLALVLALVMIFSVGGNVFANYYDPTSYYGYGYNGYNPYNGYNYSYSGENYYNYNYGNYYYGSYYMSPWTEDLKIAYDPTWYESPQREVLRGEAFLLYLRAVQRSLDRQGYTRLMSGYSSVPFSDLYTVNPSAQSEVNVLYANRILIGYDDNTMRFSQPLSRAEMAAIYSRFNRIYFNMGVGYSNWNYDGYNNYYNNNYNNYYINYVFDDINGHWAAQDIITAASNGVLRGVGYIPGVGNNCFDTKGKLTIEQIWKMLDCCVGHQGLRRSDIAYAMAQTFKVKFGKNIDESYGTANGTKITRLTAQSSSITVEEGETKTVKVSIYPTSADYQKLQWSFESYSDNNYATVDEAWNSGSGTAYVRVYGKKARSSYMTLVGRAMDGSGKTVRIKVNVNDGYDYDYDDEYITSITPSETTVYLNVGESLSIRAKISPSSADYKHLNWTSSNSNVANVSNIDLSGSYSNGTITAYNEGTAYIYIKAQDGSGEQATVKVVVNGYSSGNTAVTSGIANPSNVRMDVGETQNVSVTLYPVNATDTNINYIVDNTNIARVEKVSNTSIRIVGLNPGTTYVRAIAASTGNEICVTPVTINGNSVMDTTPPVVEITGATIIKKDEIATIYVKVYDDNLKSFEVRKSDILGLTSVGVSVHDIAKISPTEYQIKLLGMETFVGDVCVAAGVAVDHAGNVSQETDGIAIKVLSLD